MISLEIIHWFCDISQRVILIDFFKSTFSDQKNLIFFPLLLSSNSSSTLCTIAAVSAHWGKGTCCCCCCSRTQHCQKNCENFRNFFVLKRCFFLSASNERVKSDWRGYPSNFFNRNSEKLLQSFFRQKIFFAIVRKNSREQCLWSTSTCCRCARANFFATATTAATGGTATTSLMQRTLPQTRTATYAPTSAAAHGRLLRQTARSAIYARKKIASRKTHRRGVGRAGGGGGQDAREGGGEGKVGIAVFLLLGNIS